MSKTIQEHNYYGIDATVVADSVNELGNRITTMILTMPRFLLAELNTHRMFSRNSASSRAIPFRKMIESIHKNPFIPIAWQKDHKGMQGTEYIAGEKEIQYCIHTWVKASILACNSARDLNDRIAYPNGDYDSSYGDVGVTKQLCNRLLEPFMWHTVLITATEFENFSKLRCPLYTDPFGNSYFSKKEYINKVGDEEMIPKTLIGWLSINKSAAEIHISLLAESMYDVMHESTPKLLKAGEWHIPFGDTFEDTRILSIVDNFNVLDEEEQEKTIRDAKVKIATARCARISYNNFEGNDDYAADIKLYSTLLNQGHFSPFEHCAKAMTEEEYNAFKVCEPNKTTYGQCKNFRGFIQQRYFLETENK
jgi:thymidylate synthase ThyX